MKKTEYIMVRVSKDLKEKAQESAKRQGVSLSEWVTDLMKRRIFLDEEGRR